MVELGKFLSKVSSKNAHCICILLKNDLDTPLTNPRVYKKDGKMYSGPQNVIQPGEFACLGFHKTKFLPFGPKGIVAYDLKELGITFCLYFNNPYFGHNKFTMSWMNEGRNVDQNLFRALALDNNIWYAYGHMTWRDMKSDTHNVMASGFIGEGWTATLQVEIKNT
ncbi:uncharacterized protein LOC134243521 [Saccostrea cucullata]|uniref:uncharacterized protein LOC134243521 n=1 Tax=Saccostrea cuccullata TaxID=36930 RepID=UPI002ED4B1FD